MYFDIISANTQDDIKDELYDHATEVAKTYGKDLDEWTEDDLHQAAFNEDYYIIGYHKASEWIKKYNVGGFDALNFVQTWEKDYLGESRQYPEGLDSETLVNMIAYILGYEVVRDVLQCLRAEREFMDPFSTMVSVHTSIGPVLR